MLIAYAEAAKSIGLDPFRMLRKAGLPIGALEQPDTMIPVDRVQALVHESALAAVCEEFGLLIGRAFKLSMMGPLGLLMREQPTVGQAVDALKRYLRYQNENVEIRTEEHDGAVVFMPVLLSEQSRRDRQMVELTTVMNVQILRALLGEAWKPVRVSFTHDPPADLTLYRQTLGTVEFNGAVNGIVLRRIDLDTKLAGADAEMAREIARFIEQTASPPTAGIADTISELIDRLLPSGHCTIDEVAQHIGVDRRTVHRRLAAEGKSFTQLLDTVRREIATDQLIHGDKPLGVVTGLLGFSSLSTFSRWFRQAYGTQPSEFRRQARGV